MSKFYPTKEEIEERIKLLDKEIAVLEQQRIDLDERLKQLMFERYEILQKLKDFYDGVFYR